MSRTQQDQFIDDEEEETCPLCVEEFDLSDKNFRPCPCGYQICQFCYNNIKTTMNGLCPACRRPYDDKNISWRKISPEELATYKAEQSQRQKKTQAAKQKEAQKREADTLSRKHLAGLRVVQKNLVYVTGLQPTTREDKLLETLRGDQYFGQYGKIVKIVVSKAKDTSHHQQSVGVYVTFARKEDAESCIAAVDGSENGDRTLRAQYGTTKYCSAYLRNETCNNRNCMFLHEPGDEGDRFTRQDLSSMNAGSSNNASNSLHPSQSQTHAPAQQAPIAAAQMNRQESSEGSNSPKPDAPALPSTASWGNKAAHLIQDRRMSRTTASSEASPAVSHATPAAHAVEEVQPEVEASQEEKTVQETPLRTSSSNTPQPPPTTRMAPNNINFLERALQTVINTDWTYHFSAPHLSEADLEFALKLPNLIDPNGGAKRRTMKERERRRQEAEDLARAQANALQSVTTAEPEDNPESGSLQLGGEPEEQHNLLNRSQHAIGPPSHQLGLGLGPSQNLENEFGNAGLQARGLSAQQQQQLLLQQFKGNSGAQNLVNSFQNGQQNQQLSQSHLTSTAPNHARQTSKFSFANDSGTASTSVKPVPNQKFMNQQTAMMPQSTSHFNQNSGPQGMPGTQFYTSSVQGPPPGLKTTGTPPVSGGGMFGQGHGFATGGLGYGANAAGRNNNNEELMRQLLRSQRSDGQGSEGVKRESMFPSFLQSHSSTSTPAPAPGLLNFPYGPPQPGSYQDTGSQKQKKKGKKHRHANTSSGGGGLVDVPDPSILQARLQHGGGGQSMYGGQGQGGFSSNAYATMNGGNGYRW